MIETYPSSFGEARRNNFPWDSLEVGRSFLVSYDQIKGNSLRTYASLVGKKLNKKFSVKDHGEKVGYEVGRIK